MAPEGGRSAAVSDRPAVFADRYKVERELGHGGMATVYLCTDLQSGIKVAVKLLKPELGGAVSVERFLREITFSSQLDHPQIPKVLGSGVYGQLPFYVMTYIEGESLRSRLDRMKQLPIEEAVRITLEIIQPTAYAHSMGIIHRDIKPANILVTKDRIYVLDFGVARAIAASADESLTSTGVAVGTPAYMSPEQALADDNLDERSDIYSLASVTYEMIAGIPPFVGATAQAVMSRRFVAPPPPLSHARETVPEYIESTVAKALAKSPADRWQTITDFGNALKDSDLSPSMQVKRVELASRKRKLAATIAAVALMVVGITGVVAWSLVDRDPVGKARRDIDLWNVGAAEARLEKSISSEGAKPETQLWLAQARILRGAPIDEWDDLALKAGDEKEALKGLDTARAAALAMYANKDGTNRCAGLRALAKLHDSAHPNDYSAAITLADCLAADPTVVADPSTKTGYRFASSYQEAVSIYEGLLTRNSRLGAAYSLLMPRLSSVLWTTKNHLRGGVMHGEVETNFIASPALVADSIVFEPQKLGGNGALFESDPEKLDRFVVQNLNTLRGYATSWVRASPNDPAAQEALGNALESVGQIDGTGESALASIKAARLANPLEEEDKGAAFYRKVRLANTHTRLLLKAGDYAAARMVADSAAAWSDPVQLNDTLEIHIDGLRAGLLSITGRLKEEIPLSQKYRSDYIVRLPSGETRKLTGEVGPDLLALLSYAAFGAPKDSIIALDARIRTRLESVVPASQLSDFKAAVLRRPLSLALDVIGTKPLASLGPSPDPFISAVRAVDAGQTGLAKKFADSLAAFRAGTAAGEVTMDVVFQEAWLRSVIGDTQGAARSLDRALRGLSRAPSNLLDGSELATALVRAMMLRAKLAAQAGDKATNQLWFNAARELWSNADPEVKATVAAVPVIR